jgi:hypothetical protein
MTVTIALVLSLVALAAPSRAAPPKAASIEKRCQELVGREVTEGTGQDSHVGQLQVQRFSDCMRGAAR